MRHPDDDRPCLVTFHAHPDDEAIFTGGTIAMAVAAGWRVVLVVATSGEEGAVPDWLGGDLGATRRAETLHSASLLGIERVEFLGFRDSGAGPAYGLPDEWTAMPMAHTLDAAPVHVVASRLRRILAVERASALTSYDLIGVYGHPDHVRVHEIAAAAVLATGCDLVEATVSRATLRRLRASLLARGLDPASWPEALLDTIGIDDGAADHELLAVDVSGHLSRKRAAIAAHASQVMEAPSFMGLPPGAFHRLLETEWFRSTRTVDGRFTRLLRGARKPQGGDTRVAHELDNSALAGR